MIKAILFDYDGVMTKGSRDIDNASRLAWNLNIPESTATNWLDSIWPAFMTNILTEAEVWTQFEAKYQSPIRSSQRDIWTRAVELRPLPIMTDFVTELKLDGYIVGILSNTVPPSRELIRQLGGYDGYDHLFLSSEIGLMKPDTAIFEYAQQQLAPIAFTETIFLDDREPAITAARSLGIHAVHVTDQAKAIQAVHHILQSA